MDAVRGTGKFHLRNETVTSIIIFSGLQTQFSTKKFCGASHLATQKQGVGCYIVFSGSKPRFALL
jgi:hypothetical protein